MAFLGAGGKQTRRCENNTIHSAEAAESHKYRN